MRKVVFYGAISLDGYLAGEDDSLQWLFDTAVGEETTYGRFYKEIDTTLMGRVTYEEVKKMSPDPIYPECDNYVVSSSLKDLPDASVIQTELLSFVQELKKQPGKNIWLVGGGSLLQPLLEADLIDEWWIQLAPVLLGKGKRLFQDGNYQQRLEYVETTTMGELVEVHYRRKT